MKESVFNSPYEVTAFKVKEGFLLLEWPSKISDAVNKNVIISAQRINDELSEYLIDLVPAYSSLGVFYKGIDYKEVVVKIKSVDLSLEVEGNFREHVIPVCYDISFGWDSMELCANNNISFKELIKLHTEPEYKVCFLGFLPGFLYLSGLDEKIATPRKQTPRMEIAPGAVGIGGSQTGIYPIVSPGGWNIIGRCPKRLFDISNESQPSIFQAGDLVKFIPIDIEEYWILNEHEV